ncbi:hypothetical protein FB45DRAFT_921040 [Roridomyces roridus]|uniref:HMG box domain-containing protein n=1 Tax=Roridomyces roridus TaxID=1738132 RepID=A0AAD7FJH5_9AGAR|nr:hypothetical protein FB45DRAFT_921040 [Roridomyces roridus]
MPVERTRGSRRAGADGANLVWTEPAVAPTGGVAFATNLTPTAFAEESIDVPDTSSSFFFFEPPTTPTKRVSHKRKATPSPSTSSSPPPPPATQQQQHIPRPPNAFILFRSAFIRSGAVPASSEPSHATLSTIAGLAWTALAPAARGTWHEKARKAREEHAKRFPGYAFRPKRGSAGDGGTDAPEEVKLTTTKKKKEAPPKRRTRETAPADMERCAHIAKLIAQGRSGAELEGEVKAFDAERGERVVEVRWESEKEVKTTKTTKVRKTSTAVRRRVKSEPTPPASSSSESEPTTPTSPVGPFDFDFLDLLPLDLDIPSSPIDDATAFAWPSVPPSPALSYASATYNAFGSSSPIDTAPSSPVLSYASPALSSSSSLSSLSAASSAWSSLDDLSSLASFGCGSAPPAAFDLSSCGAGLEMYNAYDASTTLQFELDHLGMGVGVGMEGMQYVPEYLPATTAATW